MTEVVMIHNRYKLKKGLTKGNGVNHHPLRKLERPEETQNQSGHTPADTEAHHHRWEKADK